MNKWQETVKRVAKQHPGKSLKEILPLAKIEYKKMGHSSSAPTKKHKKHHKKSHSQKRTRGRKGRKGRRGSRRMRGGGESCGSSSAVVANTTSGELSWNGSWAPEYASVESPLPSPAQSGGSHCGTHHRRRRRKGPTRKRRPKRRRMRGGNGCSASLETEPVAAPSNTDAMDF